MISIVPGRMSVKFLGIKLFVQSLCENKINQSKTSKTFVCHKLQLFNMYGIATRRSLIQIFTD